MKLKSRNPFHHPLFYPNFLSDPRDIETFLEGLREIIKISEQSPYAKLGVKLYNVTVPGCEQTEFNSDEYWRCYIRHLSGPIHHQVGTCKMGPSTDPTSVVDPSTRVHGFSNLRVVDTSIIPEPPSGHTQAYSYMFGEKIADIIQNDWMPKTSNIQRLRRQRRFVLDWQYQDPEHTTEAKMTSTTTKKRRIHSFDAMPTKAVRTMNIQEMFRMFNMSDLQALSEQFKNSTIGDIGTILWGFSMQSKIDFKTKLAEHLNLTETDEIHLYKLDALESKMDNTTLALTTTLATTSTELIKQEEIYTTPTTTSTTAISITEQKQMNSEITTTENTILQTDPASSSTSSKNEIASTEKNSAKVIDTNQTTMSESTTLKPMSGMDKIMATAPSLDEDRIRTYKLNETDRYGHGKAKPKYITKQLKTMNTTEYTEDTTQSNQITDKSNVTEVIRTTSTDVNIKIQSS